MTIGVFIFLLQIKYKIACFLTFLHGWFSANLKNVMQSVHKNAYLKRSWSEISINGSKNFPFTQFILLDEGL